MNRDFATEAIVVVSFLRPMSVAFAALLLDPLLFCRLSGEAAAAEAAFFGEAASLDGDALLFWVV